MTRIETLEKLAKEKALAEKQAEEAKNAERERLITEINKLIPRIEELCKTALSVSVISKEAFKAFFWEEIRQAHETSPYLMRFYCMPGKPPIISCDYLYENDWHYRLFVDLHEIKAFRCYDNAHKWIECKPNIEQLFNFLLNFDGFEKAFYDEVDAFLDDNIVCHFNDTTATVSEESTKLPDIQQIVRKTVSVDIETTLTTNDIFNWLTACDDITTLRYLAKHVYRRISSFENPNNNNFESKA